MGRGEHLVDQGGYEAKNDRDGQENIHDLVVHGRCPEDVAVGAAANNEESKADDRGKASDRAGDGCHPVVDGVGHPERSRPRFRNHETQEVADRDKQDAEVEQRGGKLQPH